MTMRYDRVPIKAQRTPEGYIKDTPVITRTGVFVCLEHLIRQAQFTARIA